uniref:Uncharacterized protein n=1 Tax=Sander lucioperca TaxID=283035 RepID=A0A8C9YLU1_SANLU
SAISSGSLEQSLPAAALRSLCVRRTHSPSSSVSRENRVTDKLQSQYCCSFLFQGSENSLLLSLTLRSILAKPRALDARSLASWNSSLSDRLVSITDRLQESKRCNAVLSSAHSQNSLPLFCRPASRNSPVDLSSIPAISLQRKSFPDWASPPRI